MNKEKAAFKKDFMEGVLNLYKEIGEPAPYWIVEQNVYGAVTGKAGLKDLIAAKKVVLLKDPYGVGHDFIGIVGKKYPKNLGELMVFREAVQKDGLTKARKILK